MQAAATVFARKGYHGARMDDVVAEAGSSKGALYWYFKSKEELAVALVHQMLEGQEQAARALMESEAPPMERLERLARGFAQDLVKTPPLATLSLELLSLAPHIPEIKECFARHHERFAGQLRALLRQAKGEGDAVSIDSTALALAAMVGGLVMHWTLSPEGFDLEEQLWRAVGAIVR
ncbi:TetR/AcrR family transcriptional regulator [Spirillospora sp. NPDC048911]|uniref:TetR/AcrR family transcriptional regulator n=1 Tax=Spirillospora sp. NPDC048911 TaxID=3364527 RepID=UPI00371077B2